MYRIQKTIVNNILDTLQPKKNRRKKEEMKTEIKIKQFEILFLLKETQEAKKIKKSRLINCRQFSYIVYIYFIYMNNL